MSNPMAPLPVVVSQEIIQARVRALARQISDDYRGHPLHLVAILRGAIPFLCDLSRQLELDVTFDFIQVARKHGQTPEVQIVKDLDHPLEGRRVLLVEDLIQEGRTLQHLTENLRLRQPRDLAVCVMFERPGRRVAGERPDYVGLEIDDRYLVGYGLDSQQRYRNLPYLAECPA